MELVFVIIFTSAACCAPGLALTSSAYANANVVATGSGRASAYGYAYSYYSNQGGWNYDCTYNRCTPTCSLPVPQNCPENSNPCNCPPGTIISQEGGQCVREEECPRYVNCKGDYNARYTDCPSQCPATCANPNPYCTGRCGAPGCECNGGYILSAINGICIKPDQCPGAPICRQNETFVTCYGDCPNQYCPVNVVQVACGPTLPCVGRCGCDNGYLLKSVNDRTCILATDCPPGRCYGPNEEWNRCVPRCFSDSCKNRNKVPVPGDCPFSPTECIPMCICKKGYYRNGRTCVPVQECPPVSQ